MLRLQFSAATVCQQTTRWRLIGDPSHLAAQSVGSNAIENIGDYLLQ